MMILLKLLYVVFRHIAVFVYILDLIFFYKNVKIL